MSTRATYQFATKFGKPVTFYIHHDGYPDGAASYLWNMDHFDSTNCAIHTYDAERFFRANPLAVFTDSHDAHGDTEWRYTLDITGKLTVHRDRYNDDWELVFAGPWQEFVNRHSQGILNGWADGPAFVPYAMESA